MGPGVPRYKWTGPCPTPSAADRRWDSSCPRSALLSPGRLSWGVHRCELAWGAEESGSQPGPPESTQESSHNESPGVLSRVALVRVIWPPPSLPLSDIHDTPTRWYTLSQRTVETWASSLHFTNGPTRVFRNPLKAWLAWDIQGACTTPTSPARGTDRP